MYIYAIGTEEIQKIGFSNNPETRLQTLQTGNPEELSINYIIEVDDDIAPKLEKHIHKEHNHKRIKGEWFAMTKDDVISAMTFYEITLDTLSNWLR